jgi:hypothetical protein
MSRIPDLLLIEAGTNDSDWGTAMAPTVKLMGIQNVTMTPVVEAVIFNEMRGTTAPGYEAALQRVGAEVDISGLVSYEDINYFLDGMFGQASPTTDTSGEIRAYEAPLTDVATDYPDPRIMTLVLGEGGDWATDAAGVAGFTPMSLSVSGETLGPWTFSVSGLGKEVAEDEIDTTLADRDINVVMGHQTTLFIDPATDAVGSTQIQNTAFTFNLSLESNRALVYHLGSLTPTGYRDAKWGGTLNLVLELNSDSEPFLNSILGHSAIFERVIRIKATSGDNYAQFDFNGVTTTAPEINTDDDGVRTVELQFAGKYESTLSSWVKAETRCSVETLA